MRPVKAWPLSFPFLFLLPALLVLLIGYALPLIGSVGLSLFDVDAASLRDWSKARFSGLENFRGALDPRSPVGRDFLEALLRTLGFALGSAVGLYGLGLAAALLLDRPFWGRGLVRALVLLPWATPVIVAVLTWRLMLLHDGLINHVLAERLGLLEEGVGWLLGGWAFWSLIAVNVWSYFPFFALTLGAALRAVPRPLVEAARVDGARAWARFRHVTWPHLRPLSARLFLLSLIWSFMNFYLPYALFGAAAPRSATTLPLLIYLYAFGRWDFGAGAALSLLTLGLQLGLALPFIGFLSKEREARSRCRC